MLLQKKPVNAVNELVKSYLKDASAACRRVNKKVDREALHDFRVATRRLRTMHNAYIKYPKSKVEAKADHLLKRLADTTNRARDCEVQLLWLQQQRSALQPDEQPGYEWLYERIRQSLGTEYRHLRNGLSIQFDEVKELLGKQRAKAVTSDKPAFRELAAGKIEKQAHKFQKHMQAYQKGKGDAAMHRARISAKKLRYLVEPLSKHLEGAEPVIKQLKATQEVLGKLHDLQLLAAELASVSKLVGAEHYQLLMEQSLDADPCEAMPHDERLAGLVTLGRTVQRERLSLLEQFRDMAGTTPLDEVLPPLIAHLHQTKAAA